MICGKTKLILDLLRKISLVLLITLSTSITYSQSERIHFSHISIHDGLSNNYVNCIFQDNQGYMWFGTRRGLNRYDGYNIKIYSHKSSDTRSISSSSISCIYQDKSGTLWIGTWGGGLNIFDSETEKFISYKHDSTDQNSKNSNKISSIFEDNDGTLWISTFGGLNKFNRKTKKFKHYKHEPSNPNSLSYDRIKKAYIDKDGFIWIGTNNNGLYKFDKEKEIFIHFTHDPSNSNSINSKSIISIYEDIFGTLWIGTAFGGLNKFNRKNETFTHFIYDSTNTNCLSDNTVLSIFEDRFNQDGILWIGTSKGGLNVYDRKTEKFVHFKNDPNDPSSISGNSISSIYKDNSGNLWIGTFGYGINKFILQRKFIHFKKELDNPNSLSNNTIKAIYKDKSGLLWIGTSGGGLNRYNSDQNSFTHFKHDLNNSYSLSDDKIYSIYEDNNSNLWIGTRSGLDKFDKENEIFLNYKPDPNNTNLRRYYRNNIVSAIYEDRSGTLWIGTFGSGLLEFDKEKLTFIPYKYEPSKIHPLQSEMISSIYEDKSGTIWIGTWGDGLKKFNKETKQFRHYRHDPNIPNSLSGNIITSICEDQYYNLWVGTHRSGLNNYDRVNNKFINYTEGDGLPSNRINGILEDDNGCLWINSHKGLSKFDIVNTSFTNYSREYGVNHYSRPGRLTSSAMVGYFKSHTGDMFFGGINGFIYFNPDRILEQSYISPIVLTGFRVIGKNIKFDKAISDIDQIELSYKSNYFTFEFALLDFTNVQRNQYSYKLEGLDKDWIYSGNRHYASYSNLAPGKYVFKSKGANHEGIWNIEGVSINLTIIPPFWKTWWFRALLATSFFGTIILIYWLRLANIQAQKRELESLVLIRTSEINKINDHLAQEVKIRRDTESNLRKSEEKFRDLFENANDIIWTSDIEGKLLSVNSLFEILSGHSKDKLIEKQPIDLIVPEHRNRIIRNYKKAINGKPVEYEIETISRNNERKTFWLKMRPLKEDGKVIGIHGIGRDITDLKRAEKELREAEKLKRESLKQLTLKLAHEIKNPLASIKSSAQLVATSKVTEANAKIQKHMDVINRNVDFCDKVVRDLYSFTHRPEFEFSKIKVSDFIERIKSFILEKIDHGKKVKVYINIEDKTSKIFADEFRLFQAFKNIINNAFDAMADHGILTINSKYIDSSKEVLIEIIDNGCGISSDNLKCIFQPFYSSKPTGFGLGLPLVKDIIEVHGGKIEVETELGKGSNFKIKIPAIKKK